MSTFDKIKAHEERRAAIKKQMEAMEAAAEPRTQIPSPATARRRNTSSTSGDSPGTVETARRFLVDEDDDVTPLNDPRSSQGADRRSLHTAKPHTASGQGESIWSSMKSTFSMLGSGTGKAQPAKSGKSARLAEINLVGESQTSIEEDDEEPVYRPSLCTSCYIGIRRLILGVALAIGGTYQYTRSRWEMAMGNGRGKKLLIGLLIIAAIVIPVSIVLTRDKGGGEPETEYNLTSEERHDFIYQRIVDSGISDPDDLAAEGSPQQQAFEWIVSGDHGELSHEHDYLLQRYALAVFFYATHGDNIYPPTVPAENVTGHEKEQQEGIEGHEDFDVAPAGKEEAYELAASPDWINQNRWMTSYGICAWHGVECHHRPGTEPTDNSFDDEGDVILLNLTDNNVRGTIPSELFSAHPYIRWMSLAGNGLFGTLPSEMGYLDDIRYLSLSENELGGSLPAELADMTALSLLFVDGNNFVGTIPAGIENLQELVDLSLYDNEFSGPIPTELGQLAKLESLYLDVNYFTGTIPTELANIKRLDDLRLRHNQLVGTIPSELATLEGIQILYLDRNQLTGSIPTEFGNLKYSVELHAYGNKLVGPIPTELSQLRALSSLYLDNNHLTGGIPTEFGTMIDLEQLYLHKNYLDGTIPTEVGKMSNLRNFRVYTNGLKGSIPTEIGGAWKIEHLYVHDNLLTGKLPESIQDMTRLQKLRVYWNEITGSVPEPICGLMEFKLVDFMADCSGESPQLECTCCTQCYA